MTAFDHPATTTGLWVEFECCGRNWGTVAWLAVHGRIACGACGRLWEVDGMRIYQIPRFEAENVSKGTSNAKEGSMETVNHAH
jgi:hypothetical protein